MKSRASSLEFQNRDFTLLRGLFESRVMTTAHAKALYFDSKDAGKVSGDGRAALRSQIVILEPGRHAKYPPHAFTEHGAIMAAMVLNSPEAVTMSVFVVRAFMQMREQLAANAAILKRLAEIDKTLLEHDSALRTIWTKLQPLLAPPPEPSRRRIGFNQDDNP